MFELTKQSKKPQRGRLRTVRLGFGLSTALAACSSLLNTSANVALAEEVGIIEEEVWNKYFGEDTLIVFAIKPNGEFQPFASSVEPVDEGGYPMEALKLEGIVYMIGGANTKVCWKDEAGDKHCRPPPPE